jgi:hypothetical protein
VNIDKAELKEFFITEEYDSFFSKAKEIADFVLVREFSIYNEEIRNDMSQECMENLWKKILANKVDPTKDLMAFIWQNSRFRILEILRKERNRNKKAPMLEYDAENAEWMKVFGGYVYNPELLAIYNEMVANGEIEEVKPKRKRRVVSK